MKKVLCLFLSAVIFVSAFSCVGVIGSAKGAKLTGVSFTPASELSVYEKTNGHWDVSYNEQTGAQENTFYYDVFNEYENGNVITLHYSDGKNVDYTCENWVYVNAEKKELSEETLYFIDSQEDAPWEVGENYVTMKFAGLTTEILVEILPSPLEKVEFVPVSPIELIALGDGEVLNHKIGPDEGREYFSYKLNNLCAEGNKYVATYKTGEVVTYTSDGKNFKNEQGEILDEKYITQYDVQDLSPWVDLGEHFFPFYFMGCKSAISVNIVESSIEAIQYIPANAYVFIENFNGSNVECECNACEDSGNYFEYDVKKIGFPQNGDKFIVTYKDGTVTEYTKDSKGFKDKDGQALPYDIEYKDYQAQQHWNVGTEYFRLYYKDKSLMVPVTIVENEVKSISLTSSQAVEVYRYTNGHWGTLNGKKAYFYDNPLYDGKIGLRVEYTNGMSEIYKYNKDKSAFCADDGKEIKDDVWLQEIL